MTRTALITGAARRIGARLAASLATAGYTLHLHTGTDEGQLGNIVDRLYDLHRIRPTAHVVDFADTAAVAEWARRLRAQGESFELIVNNASEFPSPRYGLEPEVLSRALTIHALAPITLLNVLNHQQGHVVNILDARLSLLDAERIGYEIAKRSLRDLTLLAAKRLAPDVRVNAIAPGLVLPPPGTDDAHLQHLAQSRSVLGRPVELGDLVHALMFLENAPSVTGQVIYVDAGEHLGAPINHPNTEADVRTTVGSLPSILS